MPPNVRALTRAEISLADWHRFWRHGLFACAVGWMLLSIFALHWAISLLGIPAWAAWAGAGIYEASMAGTATSATTTRKPDGSAYRSPWVAFSFFMAIAQVCNVGHALVEVSGRMTELPPWIPAWVVYTFAGALAAVFPLGGTMLVHMSGFLRVHGADAQWVDPDARKVLAPAVRTPRTPRAHADKPDAHTSSAQPAGPPVPSARTDDEPEPCALTDAERALPPRERARLIYDRMTEGSTAPSGSAVARAFAAAGGNGNVHSATVRRWVVQFAAEPPPAPSNGAHAVTEEDLERLLHDERV